MLLPLTVRVPAPATTLQYEVPIEKSPFVTRFPATGPDSIDCAPSALFVASIPVIASPLGAASPVFVAESAAAPSLAVDASERGGVVVPGATHVFITQTRGLSQRPGLGAEL